MTDREVTARRRHMLAALRLPLQLLRAHPGLVLRFAFASLGRAALTAATILLIREFLAGALGRIRWSATRACTSLRCRTPSSGSPSRSC